MATPVIMPRQGQSVESCIITAWAKNVGDQVTEGETLFSYETDKSAFEEPAKVSGTLLAIFANADDDVPCLANVAVIGAPGESFAEFAPGGEVAAKTDEQEAVPSSTETAAVAAMAATAERAAFVSPRAKATAARMGLDAMKAAPTGPNGRVIERDIFALSKAQPAEAQPAEAQPAEKAAAAAVSVTAASAEPAYKDEKMSHLRKVIAKSMFESLAGMAQLTHNTTFDATSILALRKQFKNAPEDMGLSGITLNDIVLYAVSRVLLHHADLNANLIENGTVMRRFNHVNLGMAVDTPRGLLVPVIFNADTKSLKEISAEAKALAKAAQGGSISPDLLSGASFTVSNLGSFGIESFTPVINPPQTGILGVCCSVDRVRTVDGVVKTYPAMGLSLTYDHRALDGAPASRFLKELCTALAGFNVFLAC